MNSIFSNLLDMRNLQEQVKKNFLDIFSLEFQIFSLSLKHFFLTVGQKNVGKKYQFQLFFEPSVIFLFSRFFLFGIDK